MKIYEHLQRQTQSEEESFPTQCDGALNFFYKYKFLEAFFEDGTEVNT